ncbi:MAG: Na+/H+ antiporter subunit E [Actinomycetota bacterium]
MAEGRSSRPVRWLRFVPRFPMMIEFALYVLYEIVVANLRLAGIVLQPTRQRLAAKLVPGIVAMPLRVEDDFDVLILATTITLTPGTISVDLVGEGAERVLYVHGLQVRDQEAFLSDMQRGFEDRILRIRHGRAEARTMEVGA